MALALGTWLHLVNAAEWSAEPRVTASSLVNTNKRLTTDEHDTVFGLIGDIGVVLQRATEINTLQFEPRVRVERYWGEENLDSDNYSFRFGVDHRFERALLGLDAAYARDNTLTTELLTTGQVQTQLAVDTVTIGPSIGFLLTERDRVDLGYNYNQVSYEEAPGSGLSDYTYKSADVTYTHDLTEKAQGFVQFSYSRFDVEDIRNDRSDLLNLINTGSSTDSYTVIGGFQGNTETLAGSASGGLIYSESELEIGGRKVTFSGIGSLFNFTLEKQFERGTAAGAYQRTVQPSGDGSQNVQDRWNAALSRRFTERMTGNLGFNHYSTITQFNEQFGRGDDTRTYLVGDAGLSYFLDPWWSVFLRYSYQQQTFAGSDDSADSNQVQLGLNYSGRKWSVSR
jgi:hypothetical protein